MKHSDAIPFPALGAFDRLRAMAAVILAGVLLLVGAGHLILVLLDPQGCVSVLTCRLGWWIIIWSAALAFLLAAMVCVVSGAKLEEMGVFSVALGLALVALGHENASYLWLHAGQAKDGLRATLAFDMVQESAGWLGVILAAYAASQLTIRRFKLSPVLAPQPSAELARGLLTVAVMTAIALLAIAVLSAGTQLAPIQTGQVCFACAAGFYLAALIAYQLSGAHSPLWAYLAVGLAALIGYLWTMASPTPCFPGRPDVANLAHLSPTPFGRALPIQFIAVGTVGAIFGNWHQRQLTRYAIMAESTSNLDQELVSE